LRRDAQTEAECTKIFTEQCGHGSAGFPMKRKNLRVNDLCKKRERSNSLLALVATEI
jgi:hypothetical protein